MDMLNGKNYLKRQSKFHIGLLKSKVDNSVLYKEGFLLGKFLPLHLGHKHLMDTASSMCEHLTILVCSIKSEPIPGKLRFEWTKELMKYKNVTIVHVTDENPQYPEEHTDFWNIWIDTIKRNTPSNLDVVFSSEDYGHKLAELLNIKHILVDKERKAVPISGTTVRSNPFKNWDYISKPAQTYYVKRIAILGPESTGKTVLSKELARYFNTTWVPEYGRELCEKNDGEVSLMDFPEIVIKQNENEENKLREANKILFCDTENITTKVFCELYHPEDFECLEKFFEYHIYKNHKKYHKYFVLSSDGADAVQDGTRRFLDTRKEHEKMIIQDLKNRNIDFTLVSGSFEDRFQTVKNEIEILLNS